MKVYDKEMYNKQESIKTTFVMIIVFLMGFIVGYLANSFSTANETVTENKILIKNTNITEQK